MKIRKDLIDKSRYSIKCPYTMDYEYVTYHNTDNSASASNEISYIKRNNNKVSFHIAVDDIEAIEVLPLDRNAWHCGDGNGNGNRKSVGVEICYSKLGKESSKFKKAEDNAVKVCAKLLKDKGLGIDRLKPHRFWSGKNCPSVTDCREFERKVKVELDLLNGNDKTSVFRNGDYTGRVALVTCDVLNVRFDRGTKYDVVGKVRKGDKVKLNYCLNNWVSVEGYSGSKGLGYVCCDYLKLV